MQAEIQMKILQESATDGVHRVSQYRSRFVMHYSSKLEICCHTESIMCHTASLILESDSPMISVRPEKTIPPTDNPIISQAEPSILVLFPTSMPVSQKPSTMSTPSNSKTFHVLIAGGGIAGLALALSLEKAGITYTLLERRSTIAPKLGASININPAGARILDQLGCYDDLLASGVVHEWVHDCTRDGRMIGPACGAPGVIRERYVD